MSNAGVAVTITKMEFENFVFPAVAKAGASGIEELRLGLAVLDTLEQHERVVPEDIPAARWEAAAETGEFLAPGLALNATEATFEFTGRELQYIAGKLREYAASGRVNLMAARTAEKLAQRLTAGQIRKV